MVGETYLPIKRLAAYYGDRRDGAHLPFNFKLIQAEWNATEIDALVRRYEAALPDGAQPNWVLGNHDNPRVASRIGPARARAAMVLLLTLRGTPTLYYGDELGLTDVEIPPDRVQDPREKTQPGHGRDPERTPMPWSAEPQAGFSTGEPWLPLNPDWPRRNVEAERADPESLLNLTRALLKLRQAEPDLHSGAWRPLGVQGEALAFRRGESFAVAINFGRESSRVEGLGAWRATLSSDPSRSQDAVVGALTLKPYEAVVLRLDQAGAP
jgi:alpha-glucosidase